MRKQENTGAAAADMPMMSPSQGSAYRKIRWERLDNTAHLFPVIADEQTSNVYRISVTLREQIEPAVLQQALDTVLPKFSGFNYRLRTGVFWNYFEENNKPSPRVREEKTFPCRYIRRNKNNSYLFRVSYYKCRINLEVFHALTDGMGAVNFLKELTYQYLRLRHAALGTEHGDALAIGTTLNREDSFLKHFKKPARSKYAKKKALLIKGDLLQEGSFGVMHGYLCIDALKTVCHNYGLTINEYLVSVYIWSIYTEVLGGMPSESPIRIAVPVNLRPFFRSVTTKNFFVMVSAEFHPKKEGYTFEEVLAAVRYSLRRQMKKEHLEQIFSYNVSRQRSLLLKILPLPIKRIGMRWVYNRSALANTTTLSNIGRIEVAEAYRPYIELFHVFMAISKGQHIKGTVCSYENMLVMSFSYDLADVSVQRGFFKKLAEDGLQVEIESNGVTYG